MVPGPVRPARASVSSKVERAALKLRHTLALLAALSSAATICSMRSRPSAGGRPPLRPRRLAAARPAVTRSRVSARSYWARDPKIPNSSSPYGCRVSAGRPSFKPPLTPPGGRDEAQDAEAAPEDPLRPDP